MYPRRFAWVLSLLILASMLLAGRSTRAQGEALQDGFQEWELLRGLITPTAFAFAPDGRLFICEKGGRVRVFSGGALLAAPFVTLSVTSNSDRGLLGIAFDPDFAANPFVYLYYTTSAGSLNPPATPK